MGKKKGLKKITLFNDIDKLISIQKKALESYIEQKRDAQIIEYYSDLLEITIVFKEISIK